MKLLPLVLAGSLAANAAAVVWVMRSSNQDGSAASVSKSTSADSDPASSPGVRPAAGVARSDEIAAYSPAMGRLLERGDLVVLMDQLKKAGYPPSVMRWLVKGKLQEDLFERQAAVYAKSIDERYWVQRRPFDGKAQSELRALNAEYTAKLKELLGEEAAINPMELAALQSRYGGLPPEKVRQVQRLTTDYDELRSQIHQTAQGMLLPEDREKLAFIDKEQNADLERLLSPEELRQFELRSSPLANVLRARLNGFEVSEAEYRALFDAAKTASGGSGSLGLSGLGFSGSPFFNSGPSNPLLAAAKNVLSPERFAEFELVTDPQYAQTARLLSRLELPLSGAKEVVNVQREGLKAMNDIRSNRTLSNEQRTAQLTTLNEQLTKRLTAVLGERGVAAYRETSGSWMRMMTQPPTARALPSGGAVEAPVYIGTPK